MILLLKMFIFRKTNTDDDIYDLFNRTFLERCAEANKYKCIFIYRFMCKAY